MLGYSHLITKENCMCPKCVRERAEKHKDALAKTIILIKDYQFYSYSKDIEGLITYLEKLATY